MSEIDYRFEFRVGIHVGDVVEESDGDLMGDGVNIAARLEGVAKPGAICLSEQAYWQVKGRLDLKVIDLGATQLKNIAEPIHVYSLEVGQSVVAKHTAAPAPEKSAPPRLSIAVLPFANMSGGPDQEYFADGIYAQLWDGHHDDAVREANRVLALDPNNPGVHLVLGLALHYSGRSEEALDCFDRALALDPFLPDVYMQPQAQALYQLGRYPEAAALLKRRILRNPDTDSSRVLLAASLGQMGQFEEAREAWREALRVNPAYSLEHRRKVLRYKNPEDFERVVEGLRKAGLPEE
jgi:adenylate cyclase